MNNPSAFFDNLRDGLMGPTLEPNEVSGCNAILAAMQGLPVAYCAYALATAWHETAAKMQPVREAFWLSEAWRKKNLRYWPWYGRGYVQLTWQTNYARADEELGLNGTMLANPDRAMEPDIAAKIMRLGMVEGWFAGDKIGRHTLARHLPEVGVANQQQFTNARRIINGTDRDLQIARYANSFQNALLAGGW
jgi:putative chitinase